MAKVFTGIARLARQGALYTAKKRVQYRSLPTKNLLNRCSSPRMPFDWTVNPYRGCEFACRYCYARYTHEFMEFHDPLDFETRIFAKDFSPESAAAEIRRLPRHHTIALGTATDPYQPAERQFGRTRRFLEAFAQMRGRSLAITTKGDLIRRDTSLLLEIAQNNTLHLNFSIATLDLRLARALEPGAPRPDLRLAAVESLSRAGLATGVFASPVLPGLTDGRRLEAVAQAASACGARRFGAQMLFLKPAAARVFLPWLEREFPALAPAYRAQFARAAYLRGETVARLSETVHELRARYHLDAHRLESPAPQQLVLFPPEK
ncbi:MAG: radical SAM protein [Bryobacteraceae bacterium]|nr:radical SAM protein [Bryobacteraceae bacterium]